MFTVLVVLPTPPFWLATTITRVRSGRGTGGPHPGTEPGHDRVLGGPRQRRAVVREARVGGRDVTRGPHPVAAWVRGRFHVKPRDSLLAEARSPRRPRSVDNSGRPVERRAHRANPGRWITPRPRVRGRSQAAPGAAIRGRRQSRATDSGTPGPDLSLLTCRPGARDRKGSTYPRRIRPGHPDHRRRWIEHVGAQDRAPRAARTAAVAARRRPPRPRRGPTTPSSRPTPRWRRPGASTTAAACRGERPRARSPRRTARPPCSSSARPRTTSTCVETEVGDDLLQEGGPPQQRLDQGDPEVGAGDRQHQPREPGARPEVAHRGAARDRLAQHRAVEQVPLPEPGRLAGADQAADHAVAGEPRRRTARPARSRPGPPAANTPRAASGAGGARCFT